MQFSTVLVLSAAGLATTAPTEVVERGNPFSCGLTMYQDATEGPISDGVNYLKGDAKNKVFWSTPNGCTIVSKSYGTAFQLCQDTKGKVPYSPPDLGEYVKQLYNACVGKLDGGGDNTVHAMQYWGDGFNILVSGGF